jgi:hypothetical protein
MDERSAAALRTGAGFAGVAQALVPAGSTLLSSLFSDSGKCLRHA